ncbi:ionotropic receptor 21a-like [Macrobrachium rosenbergii]|uniref:ionotropic receptor 21a-like n=1 Tax=Macrobrachium rosenbergii TaxID=79674 RepID=UPI0034D39201
MTTTTEASTPFTERRHHSGNTGHGQTRCGASSTESLEPMPEIAVLPVPSQKTTKAATTTGNSSFHKQLRTSQGNVSILVISNDRQFLSSFAQSADDSRLMVWGTKILVVTQLPPREIPHLMSRHWTFSMFNTMVLNVVDSGNHFSFHKAPVNVTVWPFMPYFMAVEDDNSVIEEYDVIEEMIQNETNNDSGKNIYTGRDYIMLRVVADLFNFTIKIVPVASWDEVIEKVIKRVSFMSPMRLAILPHLLPHLDFSADFEPETLTFVMAKPSLKPRWESLVYPFSEVVWISVGIILPIALLVFYLVFRLDLGIEDRQRYGWWTVTEIVLGTLLGQGLTKELPNTKSVRLVLLFWALFAFLIGTLYRGNLTAFLTLPKYPQRIETLQQLVNAKASTAYMYERRNLDLNIARHYTKENGWTPFYAAKENIWPGTCAWPIIRDAPFRHILDRYIGIFVQAGLVDQWGDETAYKFRSRTRQQKNTLEKEPEVSFGEDGASASDAGDGQEEIQPLTVVHLQGPLLLLLLCLLASLLIFAVEVIVGFCSRN